MADSAIWRADVRLRDVRVAAFRAGWSEGRLSELAPTISRADLDTLCELIRCDIELRWAQRRPVLLDAYRQRYPEVFAAPGAAARLALEDYRGRTLAGEPADLEEYHRAYGVDISTWPTPDELRAASVEPADNSIVPSVVARQTTKHLSVKPWRRGRGDDSFFLSYGDATAPPFPEIGERILHFELIADLGRGAFARVYLARQESLANRLVALKIAPAADNEPQTLARLIHPNIVPVHSVHEYGQFQITCMPFLGAVTLADVVAHLNRLGPPLLARDARKSLEPLYAATSGSACPARLAALSQLTHVDLVLDLAAQIADGLAHAHRHGVLHRDLKPANILLTDDGVPMLLDFNVASTVGSNLKPGSIGGTLPYMAPECLQAMSERGAGPNDVRVDLYALGMILYELLTGQLPFQTVGGGALPELAVPTMCLQRREPPLAPSTLNPAVTPAVNAIVLKLLQYEPNARYAHAENLAEDLRRQLSHRPLRFARNTSWQESVRKWRRRNPRLATALAAGALALAFAVLPASAIAAYQWRLDRRTAQIQRAEALVKHRAAIDLLRSAAIRLSSRGGDQAMLQQGREQAHAVLTEYGVEDNANWAESPSVRLLAPDKQIELRRCLGEVLFLLAQSESANRDPHGALHWNVRAERCFPPNECPQALARQRSALLKQLPGDAAPLNPTEHSSEFDPYYDALEFAIQGRYAKAIAQLQEFTERQPSHFMGWFVRGICHDGVGQWVDAETAFTVSASLQPDFRWVYFNRGLVRLKQRRFDAAAADLTRALELKPDWTLARLNRAIAYEAWKKWVEAERDLSIVLARSDAPARAFFLRSRVRKFIGDQDGAEQDRVEGLRRTPGDALDWTTRGVWRMEKEPALALSDFDEALRRNPRFREALQNKAIVLADYLKRPSDAIDVLDHLLELYPNQVAARAGRGVYLARLGKVEPARRDAQATLEGDSSPFLIYQMAGLYAQISKHDPASDAKVEALRLLARAFRAGFDQLQLIDADSDLDPIRNEPEFKRIVDHARQLRRPIGASSSVTQKK